MQGLLDSQGRPVVMDKPAIVQFARMVKASKGMVKASDITSSQCSYAHNKRVGGVPGSAHLGGNAVDIHGKSLEWMKVNGPNYGWYLIDYPGSHGGHFEFMPNRQQ